MFKKILIGLAISILLLFSAINVKAATFTDNQVVDANKKWTIHFNQTVFLDDPLKQDIKLVDSKGKKANITLNFGEDEKTIIVNAPQDGYSAGEKYTLTIDGYVHSKMGKSIDEAVKLNFNVRDYAVTFKDKNLEQIIRNKIGKPTGDILKSDVEKITELGAKNTAVSDISGIENLANNLSVLNLKNDKISDISVLKNFKNLQSVDLDGTEVTASDKQELEKILLPTWNVINVE